LLLVDANGRATSCQGSKDAPDAVLVRVACEQFSADITLAPARTPRGRAVESVQSALVAFVDGN
jgi:hypothetical protein